MTMRRLNARWIAAGRRRIVARGLRAEGKTFAEIGELTGVSAEQARRDCTVTKPTIRPFVLPSDGELVLPDGWRPFAAFFDGDVYVVVAQSPGAEQARRDCQ